MTRRAYSYLRFSRPEQAEGNSVRRQVELRDRFVAKMGWELDGELTFEDKGVSGFTGANLKRDLGRFLRAVKTGRVAPGSVLVIENLDRLSRQDPLEESLPVVQDLFNSRIAIATVNGEQVYESSPGDPMRSMATAMQLLVHLTLAHAESVKKGERGRDNWARKRKQAATRPMTSWAPAWVKLAEAERDGQGRLVGGRFVLDEEKAAVVRRLFKMAADGKGYLRIVQTLSAEGVPSLGGKPWSNAYVKKILASRAAIGEFQPCRREVGKKRKTVPDGEPIPNYYPAVVTEAEYYKARAAVESRRNAPGRVGKFVANLFTKLVWDAVTRDTFCAHQYRDKLGKLHKYLRPGAYKKGGSGAGMVPFEPFERAILSQLVELTADDVADKRSDVRRELEEAEARVTKLKAKYGRLQNRARNCEEAEEAEVLKLLAEVGRDLRDAEEAAEQLRLRTVGEAGHVLKDAQTILASLDGAAEEERTELRSKVRQLIRELVESIWVLTTVTNPEHPKAGRRIHHFQINLRNGKVRRGLLVSPNPAAAGDYRPALIDLRDKGAVREFLRNDPNRSAQLVG